MLKFLAESQGLLSYTLTHSGRRRPDADDLFRDGRGSKREKVPLRSAGESGSSCTEWTKFCSQLHREIGGWHGFSRGQQSAQQLTVVN